MIRILLTLGILAAAVCSLAHPTGNMVAAGEYVLWPYIDPIDDPDHKASLMAWKAGSEPEVILRSEFPGSDFMLFTRKDTVWIVERRFVQSDQSHQIRLLQLKIGDSPEVLRDWMKDTHRIGEAGFFIDGDDNIIFAAYPGIYRLTSDGNAVDFISFEHNVRRMRKLSGGMLLLLGESDVWLTDHNGNVLKKWNSLTDDSVINAPLGRNMIFDADYYDGELLLAYWGARKFIHVDKQGNRHVILPLQPPLAPHWVLFFKRDRWLFSSRLIMDGSTPRPNLERISPDGKKVTIWKKLE